MTQRGRVWLTNLLVIGIALLVFVPTLNWGLPTRVTDKYLFGDRKPWTGAEILALLGESGELAVGSGEAQTTSPTSSPISQHPSSTPHSPLPTPNFRGADVDADPILDRSKPVVLNDTDKKRAAIVQRYRLMSGQPDEFIQFKALAEMSQRTGLAKLDPRLYQYGGLWIYPVGALVKGAMVVGLIESPPPGTSAKAFYLDRPDVFGKFYVVARAYSTMWGVIACLAIAWIATRSTNNPWLGLVAAICFIALPVTRTAAHEAKPHLAGAALCLLAVVAGTKHVETHRRRWLLIAGALCGAAMGMVVSMLLSVVVVPTAWWLSRRYYRSAAPSPGTPGEGRGEGLRESLSTATQNPPPKPLPAYGEREPNWGWLLAALAVAAFVYAITNPFVIYNALAHPEILKSNLGNSTAMYGVDGGILECLSSTIRIAVAGLRLSGLLLGVISVGMLVGTLYAYAKPLKEIFNSVDPKRRIDLTAAILLSVPAVLVLFQFIALSAGKPAEYARFGFIVVAALVVAFSLYLAIGEMLSSPQSRTTLADLLLACIMVFALFEPFIPSPLSRRAVTLGSIRNFVRQQSPSRDWLVVGVAYEPAPWSSPTLNVFKDRIILVRDAHSARAAGCDVFIFPTNLRSQVDPLGTDQSCDWKGNEWRLDTSVSPQRSQPPSRPHPNPLPEGEGARSVSRPSTQP